MGEYVTRFEAQEGVSRENFNLRIDEMNEGLVAVEGKVSAHTHPAGDVGAGRFPDPGVMAADGEDYTTPRVRNIYADTATMTAGETALANGAVYLQYE